MAAVSDAQPDRLPGGMVLTYLPALGAARRNPNFWCDAEVRRLVIANHRQMTIEKCRTAICAAVGPDRTPSKSALSRVWKRLDKAIIASRLRPTIRGGR